MAEAARAERLAREAGAVEAQGGKDTVVAGCAIVKKVRAIDQPIEIRGEDLPTVFLDV